MTITMIGKTRTLPAPEGTGDYWRFLRASATSKIHWRRPLSAWTSECGRQFTSRQVYDRADASTFPVEARCQATGCKQRWAETA